MKPLGPDEGINALRHPDCRFCDEYQRLMRGPTEEVRQLKAKVAKVEAETLSSPEEKNSIRTSSEPVDSGLALKQILSAFKVWKQATESRCRLLSSREASDSMLFPDRAFIDAVEQIRSTQQHPIPDQLGDQGGCNCPESGVSEDCEIHGVRYRGDQGRQQ